MKLEFLGTGAANFNPEKDQHKEGFRRFSSALLDDTLMIDPGPHFFHYIETFGKNDLLKNLKYVIITHTHGDHFCRENTKKLHELYPECQFFGSERTGTVFEDLGIPFTPILPFVEKEVGEYKITALPSSHCGDFVDEITYHYSIVDKDGKKFFYGADGGLFPERTKNYVIENKYDLYVMELTIGDLENAPHLCSHMTLPTMRLLIKAFTKDSVFRPLAENGKFLVTHIAKEPLHEDHATLTEQLKPLGITPAYDGMIVHI